MLEPYRVVDLAPHPHARILRAAGPVIGEHTRHVLGAILGYDDRRIEDLRAAGVVAFAAHI